MKTFFAKHRRTLIILCLILVYGYFYFLQVNPDVIPQSASLAIGKAKWMRANLSNYNMHIEVNINDTICLVDVDIYEKTNATILLNTCGENGYVMPQGYSIGHVDFNLFDQVKMPPTIGDLFFASSILNISEPAQHAPNGRECDGFYSYSINYDPALGYPRTIEVVHHNPVISSPDHFCTLVGAILIYPSYTISVTPLP